MQKEAQKILDIFNLERNRHLTDSERLKMIEAILVTAYKEAKEIGFELAVLKYRIFTNSLLNETA